MVDNIEIIRPLLNFDDPDKFYFLQILRRRKENPEMEKENKVIKNYYISNMEYLDRKYDEIKNLCQLFNARAMLRLNRRSYKKVALEMLRLLANYIASEQYVSSKSLFTKVAGQFHAEKEKLWLLDYDGDGSISVEEIIKLVRKTPPLHGPDKVIAQIPSKNGVHIISRPFNVLEFNKKFLQTYGKLYGEFVTIHKDNPVNLFIPS